MLELLKDVKGIEQLAIAVRQSLLAGDRDRALLFLSELRELARHAFALTQHWNPPPMAVAPEGEPDEPVPTTAADIAALAEMTLERKLMLAHAFEGDEHHATCRRCGDWPNAEIHRV